MQTKIRISKLASAMAIFLLSTVLLVACNEAEKTKTEPVKTEATSMDLPEDTMPKLNEDSNKVTKPEVIMNGTPSSTQ